TTGRQHTSPLFPYTTLFRSTTASRMAANPSDQRRKGRGISAGSSRFQTGQTCIRCAAPSSRSAEARISRVISPRLPQGGGPLPRSEEHTSELQSRENLVCRL